ncbi:hypothetical protein FR271_21980 [Vibrio vulnificus]|nr:hypothetical protein [Vibrio vulnificus]EGR0093621.1 hypothetical protein [Vibrio vulnificus]EIJ0948494.1 hypothetical protein [Vibrio vulnificus]
MNIAELLKEEAKEKELGKNQLISICKDFAIEVSEKTHEITFDFIDDSVLTITNASWKEKGFVLLTQNKRV